MGTPLLWTRILSDLPLPAALLTLLTGACDAAERAIGMNALHYDDLIVQETPRRTKGPHRPPNSQVLWSLLVIFSTNYMLNSSSCTIHVIRRDLQSPHGESYLPHGCLSVCPLAKNSENR
jgi:hypothetical protein